MQGKESLGLMQATAKTITLVEMYIINVFVSHIAILHLPKQPKTARFTLQI